MPPLPTRRTLVVLTFLAMLGPLSTDFYLPSLPAIALDLAASHAEVELTLSVFLLGFGLSMVLVGPLSDRFGRRPVLLGSLLLYALGSAAAMLAPSIGSLVAARLVQALGASVGPVVSRAMVRDLWGTGETGTRALSWVASGMALGPLVGPVLGGYVGPWLGWRFCFVVLLVFALVMLWATARYLPESNLHRNPRSLQWRGLRLRYGRLLRSSDFRWTVYLLSCGFTGLFCFISAGPFAFISVLGFSPSGFSWVFALMVMGYISGTLLTLKLKRDEVAKIRLGQKLSLVGALAMFSACVLLPLNQMGAVAMVAMAVFAMGFGLLQPTATALSLRHYPKMAGLAQSLVSSIQTSIAALMGVVVAHGPSPQALGWGLLAAGVGVMLWREGKKLRKQ